MQFREQTEEIWTLIIFMNFLYFVKKHAPSSQDGWNQFYVFHMMLQEYTVQPAQVRNMMKCPYFFIIGRFGDFLS